MIAAALVSHGAELAGTPPREILAAVLAVLACALGSLVVGLGRR